MSVCVCVWVVCGEGSDKANSGKATETLAGKSKTELELPLLLLFRWRRRLLLFWSLSPSPLLFSSPPLFVKTFLFISAARSYLYLRCWLTGSLRTLAVVSVSARYFLPASCALCAILCAIAKIAVRISPWNIFCFSFFSLLFAQLISFGPKSRQMKWNKDNCILARKRAPILIRLAKANSWLKVSAGEVEVGQSVAGCVPTLTDCFRAAAARKWDGQTQPKSNPT